MYKKPSNLEFKKVFDRVANDYDKITNRYAVERRIEFFKQYAQGKCLEVGAGSGEISKALSPKHEVVATDISSKMVSVMKRKIGIKAYVCDAEKLPFKNSSFDTVVAAELIYYLDKPKNFVREANRILKKKGRILISSATRVTEIYDRIRSLLRRLGLSSMYFEDPNRRFTSENELRTILVKNGFELKITQKAVVFPFKKFDSLNRFLEKTPLNSFASFAYFFASKKN